jgi:porin
VPQRLLELLRGQLPGGASIILVVCRVFVLLLISLTPAAAEDSSDTARLPAIGGPTSVEKQMERDRETRGQTLYEIAGLKPWISWKDGLAERHGFTFSTDYTPLAFEATASLDGGDDDASGAVWRAYGTWELFGRGSSTPGKLVWRVTDAHSFSDTSPLDYSLTGIGNVSAFVPVHDDAGSKLANLYWHQSWNNGGLQVNAGFFDVADLMEFYPLTDPFTTFQNLQFLTGVGTVPLPSAGSLGMVAAAWLNDNFYFSTGIVDTNGDPKDPFDGFDTFFDDKEYFTFAELGWTTSKSNLYLDDVHVTVWQVDERAEVGSEDGWGAVFSFARYLDGKYLPFVKAGYANDACSLLEKSVSVGIGYQPWHDQGIGSLLGVGVNWGEPNPAVVGPGLDDQYALETFFRWQISREIAFTPSIQFLKDPALNKDEDQIWVFGARLRVAL